LLFGENVHVTYFSHFIVPLYLRRPAGASGSQFEPDPYDGHLNHQELTKTLLDLSSLYREAARIGVSVGRGRRKG
jgi:hypothetical protein